MKQKDATKNMIVVAVIVLLGVGVGAYFFASPSQQSSIGGVILEDGEAVPQWANKIVNYEILVSDKFTGADVSATAKVYDEQPEGYGNPREAFDDASLYTVYTASSGVISVDKEFPSTYFVVMEATGYNTEFFEIEIPDGAGRSETLVDYNSEPDKTVEEMSLVGATTDEDFAFTLLNDTSVTLKETLLLTVDANTEFIGWKGVVSDELGISTDADNDGVYDEGVSKVTLTIGSKSVVIFDPDNQVDLFDSNDEYTISLDGVTVADESDLTMKIEIEADATGDYSGANDEVLGEGDGVIIRTVIFDQEANLFATNDAIA